jgi:hypothetical protein
MVSVTVNSPNITGVTPATVSAGGQITVNGTFFGSAQGYLSVGNYNNWWTCQVNSWSDSQVVATLPTNVTPGWEVVPLNTQAGAQTIFVSITVTAPNITNISPTNGSVGTQVTITGTGFGALQGSSTVTFGGVLAPNPNWSDTSITVSAPPGVMTGFVVVTVTGAASNGVIFRAPTSNFTLTGNLTTSRIFPMATLLNSGKVLITGGLDANWNGISSAEVYDTTTGTFVLTGSLNTGRGYAAATLLSSGQVLITGGSDPTGTVLASAELYDPAATTFTPLTAHMTVARNCHVAILLNNGKILLAGGSDQNGTPLTSAELFDPSTGTFSVTTGQMATGRAEPTATLLNSGLVLIAGGADSNGNGLATAELFDPATGSFTPTGALTTGRGWGTASILNSGKVLLTGGYDGNGQTLASAEIFDPATGTFALTGSLSIGRTVHTATLLNNGKILVTGGWDNNGNVLPTAELYDPTTRVFTSEGSMSYMRGAPTAVRLTSGQVLLVGGYEINSLATAELYQPSTLTPPALLSISVAPQTPTISVGTGLRFIATGMYTDSHLETLVSATWSSSIATVATISNDGSNYGGAWGVANGTTTVTGCAGAICGSTSLTVQTTGPVILGISPPAAAVGTSVQLTGGNFGSSQGSNTVSFNGVNATTFGPWSNSAITVTVPNGATTGNVLVTVNGVSSNGVVFTVGNFGGLGATTISLSSTPPSSNYGDLVTLRAAISQNGAGGTVTFYSGGSPISGAIPLSGGAASFPTSSLPAGSNSIVASYSGDANYATNTSQPVIAQVAPVITGLPLSQGPALMGFTITGNGFGSSQVNPQTNYVSLNGVHATILSWNDNGHGSQTITVQVPDFHLQPGSPSKIVTVVVTVGGIPSKNQNPTFTVTGGFGCPKQ